MTSLDARIWDCFAQDNPYFHTVSWDAFRDADRLVTADYWRSGEKVLDGLFALGDVREPGRLDVLEIGCGIGRLTLPLARRCRSVVGLDISPEMLVLARREVERTGLKNIRLVQGDGRSLGAVRPASTDLVVSYVVFQHLSKRRYVHDYLYEAARILRPGGQLIFQCPTWNLAVCVQGIGGTCAGLLRKLVDPRRAYWAALSYVERRRRLRRLAETGSSSSDRDGLIEDVRAAGLHAARRMKSIHLTTLQNWLEDSGFEDLRMDRPPGVHVCFAARRG